MTQLPINLECSPEMGSTSHTRDISTTDLFSDSWPSTDNYFGIPSYMSWDMPIPWTETTQHSTHTHTLPATGNEDPTYGGRLCGTQLSTVRPSTHTSRTSETWHTPPPFMKSTTEKSPSYSARAKGDHTQQCHWDNGSKTPPAYSKLAQSLGSSLKPVPIWWQSEMTRQDSPTAQKNGKEENGNSTSWSTTQPCSSGVLQELEKLNGPYTAAPIHCWSQSSTNLNPSIQNDTTQSSLTTQTSANLTGTNVSTSSTTTYQEKLNAGKFVMKIKCT